MKTLSEEIANCKLERKEEETAGGIRGRRKLNLPHRKQLLLCSHERSGDLGVLLSLLVSLRARQLAHQAWWPHLNGNSVVRTKCFLMRLAHRANCVSFPKLKTRSFNSNKKRIDRRARRLESEASLNASLLIEMDLRKVRPYLWKRVSIPAGALWKRHIKYWYKYKCGF